jgi:hypothetical protein
MTRHDSSAEARRAKEEVNQIIALLGLTLMDIKIASPEG